MVLNFRVSSMPLIHVHKSMTTYPWFCPICHLSMHITYPWKFSKRTLDHLYMTRGARIHDNPLCIGNLLWKFVFENFHWLLETLCIIIMYDLFMANNTYVTYPKKRLSIMFHLSRTNYPEKNTYPLVINSRG